MFCGRSRGLFCCILIISALAGPGGRDEKLGAQASLPLSESSLHHSAKSLPLPDDSISLPGLPEIGLWMLAPDGGIARWMGQSFRGKEVLEPINIIILDSVSKSVSEASSRLERALKKASFPHRTGHSTGYSSLIGGKPFAELHQNSARAISDAPFYLANDHGRLFGPQVSEAGIVITAALSREGVNPITLKHTLNSFNRARDRFADALAATGAYAIDGFLALDNAVLESPSFTTFDHDGIAILLVAEDPSATKPGSKPGNLPRTH